MAQRDVLKRAVMGLALVALLAAMNSADAQRRRLPSRTEPIPDTESGRPAGTSDPNTPRLIIYGPPVPPLGAPPAPPSPEPSATPAPAATPPVAVPAPVVTPIPATPAPVAVPVPPPAPPPAPVAVPAPAPIPSPAPVAAPAPTPPPAPAPAPIAIPAPVPKPAPVVTPVPAIAPAPVAAPVPVAPRAIAAVAPALVATPKLDAKLVEQIFSCLAPGLPQDWKRTWVVVTSAETAVAAKFYVTTSYRDQDAEEFVPCNAQEVSRRITGLNDALPPERRAWKTARLVIDNEGEFELKYDYAR